ncbi:hypothetical protein D3C71_1153700 [compost metagenome]
MLDAESAVDLGAALVIGPAHPELDHAFGLHQALEHGMLGVVRVLFDERPQAQHHLLDGLHEFRLLRVARGDATQEVVQTLHFQHDLLGVLRIGAGCAILGREPFILVHACT